MGKMTRKTATKSGSWGGEKRHIRKKLSRFAKQMLVRSQFPKTPENRKINLLDAEHDAQ